MDGNVFSHEEKTESERARLTLYTTAKKDFALRYLALKNGKSVNELINDTLDSLFKSSKINPEDLQDQLP